MTIPQNDTALQKRWLPLVLIIVLTISIFIVSIISLISGWQTIFQNLFYFPIILACVYYVRRGFIFSVLVACGYFILMTFFSKDPVVLEGALVRVLIFILVSAVITYLSIIRIRAEEALKQSAEFNRGLVENMPDLVMVYDNDRKIRYVNPKATTILGYSADEMGGTDIMNYIIPNQHAEVAVAIQERFSSGMEESFEVGLVTKSGQNLTVISKGAPVHFQNQPAVLILLADISERKQAEEALYLSNKKLNLLSGITRHDIRNKVTTIQGFIRFARKSKTIEEIEPFLDKISDSAKAIENQIAFSKDYQELGVKLPKWLDLSKLIVFARNPAINISDKTGTLQIYADPLFEKVLYNLIDNTIRHSEIATDITVSFVKGPDSMRIIWEDNGTGVPVDKKDLIFQRGYGKNTGLGLFLIREILAITGMTIIETGEPGKGARFEITVPGGKWRFGDE